MIFLRLVIEKRNTIHYINIIYVINKINNKALRTLDGDID